MSSCEPRGPFAVKRIWFRTSTRPQRTQESYSCCLFHNITLDKMTNHYPKLPSLIPSRFALSNVFWDLNTILPLFTRAINPDQHWHQLHSFSFGCFGAWDVTGNTLTDKDISISLKRAAIGCSIIFVSKRIPAMLVLSAS